MSDIRTHYRRLALDYDRLVYGSDAWLEALARLVSKELGLRPGQRVLDVAGGTGRFAAAIRDVSQVDVWLVDQSPEMVDAARRRIGPAFVTCGDLTVWTPDREHDVVLVKEAAHHFPDPTALLRRICCAALTGGGKLATATLELVGSDLPEPLKVAERKDIESLAHPESWFPDWGSPRVTTVIGPRLDADDWRRRLDARAYSYLGAWSDEDISRAREAAPPVGLIDVAEQLTIAIWTVPALGARS